MTKMNPIHARMLDQGKVKLHQLDVSQARGLTTIAALELLAEAIRQPNQPVCAQVGDWHEEKRARDRAIEIATGAGLDLIHKHGDSKIIFEYKP